MSRDRDSATQDSVERRGNSKFKRCALEGCTGHNSPSPPPPQKGGPVERELVTETITIETRGRSLSGFRNKKPRVSKRGSEVRLTYSELTWVTAALSRHYNGLMARGWESKSVEAQQAEASEESAKLPPPMSPEEATRFREREGLRLARQRVLQQLEASTNPRHRKLLQDSLADLDEKLSK